MEQFETYFDRFIVSGGIMMALLLPLSVYTLGLILQGFIVLRRSRVAPLGLIETGKGVSSPTEYAAFRQSLVQFSHPLARVVLAYFKAAEKGESPDPDENPGPLDNEVDRLYHHLTPLGTIYTVAPLIGLLGTILGMSQTFFDYANNPQHDIANLTQGINEALVTTMWGLIIAIPAYVFASVLRGIVFKYEKETMPEGIREIMRVCLVFSARKRLEMEMLSTGAQPAAQPDAAVQTDSSPAQSSE